jgi:hypothetical protein
MARRLMESRHVVCWMAALSCCGLPEWRLVRRGSARSARWRRRDERMPGECKLGATGLMDQG